MTTRSTDRAAPRHRPGPDYLLRLYVSSAAPSSSRAVVNTRAFCEAHLAGRYELEILSIADNVGRAATDQVIAAPTLLLLTPPPVRRFIGDMSDPRRLLAGLGLQRKETP